MLHTTIHFIVEKTNPVDRGSVEGKKIDFEDGELHCCIQLQVKTSMLANVKYRLV